MIERRLSATRSSQNVRSGSTIALTQYENYDIRQSAIYRQGRNAVDTERRGHQRVLREGGARSF
jgi:hypothetical protein